MSETGNGRKNWTRVVVAVGLVFLAVAGGIVLANANKVINKTEKKDEETPLISIGFSQVGAESEWRTGNSISIKTTFSQKRGYDLIFKDAQQQQEQQIKSDSWLYTAGCELYCSCTGSRNWMGYSIKRGKEGQNPGNHRRQTG